MANCTLVTESSDLSLLCIPTHVFDYTIFHKEDCIGYYLKGQKLVNYAMY